MAAFGTDQDMVQRMLTAETHKKARRSLITAAFMDLPIAAAFVFIWILLFAFYQKDPTYQPAATADPLAVHERAVARQPVVDQRELAARALQLRVQPGDLAVPADAQVRRRVAADAEHPDVGRHQPKLLLATAVAMRTFAAKSRPSASASASDLPAANSMVKRSWPLFSA